MSQHHSVAPHYDPNVDYYEKFVRARQRATELEAMARELGAESGKLSRHLDDAEVSLFFFLSFFLFFFQIFCVL